MSDYYIIKAKSDSIPNQINYKDNAIFNIKSGENNYKLTISYNETIIFFEVVEENILPKKEFSLYQSLEELIKLDKYFRQFDKLEEVFDILKELISKNNLKIIKEGDKHLNLKINILYNQKEIIIRLNLKEKDTKSEIESLKTYISSLDNKINNYKKQIDEIKFDFNKKLNDVISKQNSINNKLKEDINKLNVNINYLNRNNNKIDNISNIQDKLDNIQSFISDSSVIMRKGDSNFITKIIYGKMKKVIKSYKKIYQASVNGNNSQEFHLKCDNIPNTLTLIQNTEGRRIGGFASVEWESPSKGKYKDDCNAFLFSLDKQKIYLYKNDGNALFCKYDLGPTFGKIDKDNILKKNINAIMVKDKFLYTNESSKNQSYNFYGDEDALCGGCPELPMPIKEIEVFKIIFEND